MSTDSSFKYNHGSTGIITRGVRLNSTILPVALKSVSRDLWAIQASICGLWGCHTKFVPGAKFVPGTSSLRNQRKRRRGSALIFRCQCCQRMSNMTGSGVVPNRILCGALTGNYDHDCRRGSSPAINIPLWTVNSLRIAAIKSYKSYKTTKWMQAMWKIRRR